jgi:hypothetical protein
MARKHPRPRAAFDLRLEPSQTRCWLCGGPMWVAYRNVRTISTLEGLRRLTLRIRRCESPACDRYHRAYDGRPPRCASGLKLHDRLQEIGASTGRVVTARMEERGAVHRS